MINSSRTSSARFRFLARWAANFAVPTGRLIALVLGGAAAVLAAEEFGVGLPAFWSYLLLLAVLSLVDLALLPRRSGWSAVRRLPGQADVREGFEIGITLRLSAAHLVQVELEDDAPQTFRLVRNQLSGAVEGGSGTFYYTAMALERGAYELQWVDVRYWGGLGLWKKQTRLYASGRIDIYPDLSRVRGVLASVQDTLILDGNRLFKRQLQGSDFHYIRDYAEGDDPRQINWKATARSARLMSNQFQPEKGKIVTLLLDCGRLMGVELDGQVKLDRTLEAALTLAAVALKKGDQVALVAFSNRVKVFVPPGRGLAHLQELTRAVFDLRADFVESGYHLALEHVLLYLKKRSLIVIFSDMESYLYDRDLLPYAQKLRAGHRLLLLSLNDPLLHAWTHMQVADSRSAFAQSVAHKFTLDRAAYVRQMNGRGIPVLDVPAERLALDAIRVYLDLKAKDAL